MQYQIIKRYGLDDLEDAVTENIREGWAPQGGVCVTFCGEGRSGENIILYVQAMILDAEAL